MRRVIIEDALLACVSVTVAIAVGSCLSLALGDAAGFMVVAIAVAALAVVL